MAMAAWKRRLEDTCLPEAQAPPSAESPLPTDLFLEIVARSDTCTLVRCAAACKLLCRDILDPRFIQRVTGEGGIMASRLLVAFIRKDDHSAGRLVNLLHPATPVALRFTDDILVPYMMPHAANLLRQYEPITSRGGLVVLRRRCSSSEAFFPLCVYNPMTGHCTHLSHPPGLNKRWYYLRCVLLTAEDGIGCSFMLVAVEVGLYNKTPTRSIRVQTAAASSSNVGGTNWVPVRCLPFWQVGRHPGDIVVLYGRIIHWLLVDNSDKILTYDIRTEMLDTVKLPPANSDGKQRILGLSPDGKLRYFVADRLMIYVWLLLSDGWVLEVVVDAEEKLRSLCPHIPPGPVLAVLYRSWERSNVVLLRLYIRGQEDDLLIVFDFETKEMRIQDSDPSLLFEVDLTTRLQAMRLFS